MGQPEKPKWESVDAEAAITDAGLQAQPEANSQRDFKDDPFGNEENAEVKYRTMKWW
jgi:hypothetical protein